MEQFSDYNITIPYRRTTGNIKTVCPQCAGTRGNPKDKSLSVNLDKGVWNCHHCGWSGRLKEDGWKSIAIRKPYKRPEPRATISVSPKIESYFIGRGISSQTLKEANVDEGIEFMPQDGKEMNVIRFNFYINGELVNTKYRTGNKHFKLIAEAELPPFNIDAIRETPECIITEGEIDCLSFIEAGRHDVISVPNGAKSTGWLDDYMEGWLDDKETIYIASDNDPVGLEMRDELIRRLGAERCRLITYGEGCKDANEHLVKYGKESLLECVTRAKDVKISGVFTLNDYEDELDSIYLHGLQKGMTIGHPQFDELISFETKRLCIVTGIPSSGKSEFIDEMCVRLNVRYGLKTAFFSPENMPIAYHAVKLIEKLSGKKCSYGTIEQDDYKLTKEYMEDNFFHIMPEDGSTLTAILEKAEYLVRRKGIKILVIDPYNRLDNEQDGKMNETQYISWQLDRMTAFAQRNDVLVILMAHPHKINRDNSDAGIPTLYNINGSAHFYNKADFGIVVHRNYGDNGYTLVRISKVKFRHLGERGDVKFKYDVRNGRYVEWNPDDNLPPTFDNRSFITQQEATYYDADQFHQTDDCPF